MSKGEKILSMFPQGKVEFKGVTANFYIDGYCYEFSKSWWEAEYEEPTTKNDLGVEYISRSELMAILSDYYDTTVEYRSMLKEIAALPSVTPQEPQAFKWCTDCREYDQEKHCCHRWSKVIRDTVEEMRQEYIEREVLDKIRAEIETEKLEDSPNFCIKAHNNAVDRVLQIIDKYDTGIKTVANAEETEAHPINENILKGFEEFTKMMFRQGQVEREAKDGNDD